MQNHFELFNLPVQFELDGALLDKAFREVQSRVHPDKFVSASQVEQRVAMQWATRANEAYQILKSPLKRARYLCELHGVDLETESNTTMPAAFLMQQMEWREALEEAEHDSSALNHLIQHVASERNQCIGKVAEQLKNKKFHDAAQSVRQLMFLEKFSDSVAHVKEDSKTNA